MTDMHNEVVEAVVEQYNGVDEDIAADCLVYLSSLKVLPLAVAATIQLDVMDRCNKCGSKLEEYAHTEYHTEVDEPPYCETVVDLYCPQCDIGGYSYYA